MEDEKTRALPESKAMNGGKGPCSYAQNSSYQVILFTLFNIPAYLFLFSFLLWATLPFDGLFLIIYYVTKSEELEKPIYTVRTDKNYPETTNKRTGWVIELQN